jgi:putative PIN family toxin of toxin-antitoxin system
VVLSGVLWGGNPLRILELWAQNRITVFASDAISEEYQRVLMRKRHGQPVPELTRWVDFIHARIHLVTPRHHFMLCRDPDDDKFLDCAVEAKVDFLVSGDGDLLALREIEGIPIMTAGRFLRTYSRE